MLSLCLLIFPLLPLSLCPFLEERFRGSINTPPCEFVWLTPPSCILAFIFLTLYFPPFLMPDIPTQKDSASVLKSSCPTDPISSNSDRTHPISTSPLDHCTSSTHSSNPYPIQHMANHSDSPSSSSFQSGDSSSPLSNIPDTTPPSVTVQAPELDAEVLTSLRNSCLFGKIWGGANPFLCYYHDTSP